MKKVVAILAVGMVVSMSAMTVAGTSYINVPGLGTYPVVTRSAVGDPTNGDAQSWQGGNNRKDMGAGGSGYGANWGKSPGVWPGADVALIGVDKAELQAQVTAAGAGFDAWYMIPLRAGATGVPNMVVGLFQADNIDWASANVSWNKANAASDKWTSAATQYNDFELMANATGVVRTYGSDYLVANMNVGSDAAGVGGVRNSTMRIHIGPELVNAYLAGNYSGFFFSNTDQTGTVRGYGGTQWGQGVGCQSIMITPEPATMVLLALGGLALIRRRNA